MFSSITIRKPLSADIERGEYLSRAAGCMSCHTNVEEAGMLLTGGRPINSPYGVFYSTNITPDRLTGIGTWSDDDFIKALRHGRSPEGKPYYPVFPYLSYAKMRNQDILDIKAYLFAQKPILKKNLEHRLRFPFFDLGSNHPSRQFSAAVHLVDLKFRPFHHRTSAPQTYQKFH